MEAFLSLKSNSLEFKFSRVPFLYPSALSPSCLSLKPVNEAPKSQSRWTWGIATLWWETCSVVCMRQCSNCSSAQKSFFNDEMPSVIPSLPDQSEPPEAQVFNFASLAKLSRRSTAIEAESNMPFLEGLSEDVQSEYANHKSSGMMFLLAVITFVMQQSNTDSSRTLVLLAAYAPPSPFSSLCSLRSYRTRH